MRHTMLQQQQPNRPSGSNQTLCYNCNEPGHYARDCRTLPTLQRPNILGSQNPGNA